MPPMRETSWAAFYAINQSQKPFYAVIFNKISKEPKTMLYFKLICDKINN